MNAKLNKFIYSIISIYIISFLLNFLWESLHAPFLYTCCQDKTPAQFIQLILYASSIDGLMVLLMYGLVSLFSRSIKWINKITRLNIFGFILTGIVIAILIEVRAILTNRWEYSVLMPTLFGIGLSPLMQLSITGLIALLVTKRLLR